MFSKWSPLANIARLSATSRSRVDIEQRLCKDTFYTTAELVPLYKRPSSSSHLSEVSGTGITY